MPGRQYQADSAKQTVPGRLFQADSAKQTVPGRQWQAGRGQADNASVYSAGIASRLHKDRDRYHEKLRDGFIFGPLNIIFYLAFLALVSG